METPTLISRQSTSVSCATLFLPLNPIRALSCNAEDESPYPEVRSAVANTDDPTMPAGTLRAWILGLIWAVVIPGVNQFYFFRYPSVTIGPVCVPSYLQRHPLSMTLAVARCTTFVISRRSFNGSISSPSSNIWHATKPWAIFDQGARCSHHYGGSGGVVCICCMSRLFSRVLSLLIARQTDIIAVQRFYYHKSYNFGYQFIVVMSTQLIGFSIGGIAKRFLVSPPSMSKSHRQTLRYFTDNPFRCRSLAIKPSLLRAVQHPPRTVVCWCWQAGWPQP